MINIILIIACSTCGYCIGEYFKKRIVARGHFYNDLLRYLDTLKLNVTTKQAEMGDFNNKFVTGCSRPFCAYIDNREFKVKISTAEKTEIENFFNGINCVSSAELLKNIDYYSKIFATKYHSEIVPEVKKAALYPKLGILCGVMIGILLF